jgi:hypothetical protein
MDLSEYFMEQFEQCVRDATGKNIADLADEENVKDLTREQADATLDCSSLAAFSVAFVDIGMEESFMNQ